MDISDLSITINNFEDDKINAILGYLKCTVRLDFTNSYRDKELFNSFNSTIREYVKFLISNDFAITPTNEKLIDEFENIISQWQLSDRIFSLQLLEQSKQIIISSLHGINSYLISPDYFQNHHVDGFIMPIKDPERKLFNEMKENTFKLRENIVRAYEEMCKVYNSII